MDSDWDFSSANRHDQPSSPKKALGQLGSRTRSIQKRQKSKKSQRAVARSLRPGIKVDTSVSRNAGRSPKQIFESRQDSLANRSLEYRMRSDSIRRGGKHTSQEGLLIHISPSDRVIPIGMAVPESQAEAHMQSAVSPLKNELPPVTPTILITPAREDCEWQAEGVEDFHRRLRTASSIYSRPTTYIHGTDYEHAPPVPSIPSSLSHSHDRNQPPSDSVKLSHGQPVQNRDSTMTAFEEDEDMKQRDRSDSNGTLFEEDDGRSPPVRTQSRTRFRKPQDLSIETALPTPQRSTGWWNLITTPFELARSPFRSRSSPISASDDAPPVPVLHYPAPISGSSHWPKGESKHVPDSPHSECSELSDWTDMEDTHPVHSHQKGRSGYTLASPDEGEVPIMLDSDAESTAPSPQPFKQTPPPMHGAERRVETQPPSAAQRMEPSTAAHVSSPLSSELAFSPGVVGIAAIAPIVSMRTMVAAPIPPPKNSLYFPPPPKSSFGSAKDNQERQKSKTPVAFGLPHPGQGRKKPAKIPLTVNVVVNDYHKPDYHRKSVEYAQHSPKSIFQYEEGDDRPRSSPWWSRLWRGKKASGEKPKKKKSRRRRCCICCLLFLFFMVIMIIVILAVLLSRKHGSSIPGTLSTTQIQWLNVTGFPAVPSGIVTVAQPDLRFSQSGCAAPSTLWSCALPKEEQSSLGPNNPDQPNFRFEILQNTSNSIIPSPSPPNIDEQKFLGNTTDSNSLPFEGEQTPFYISFLSTTTTAAATITSSLMRRAAQSSTATPGFPDLLDLIPPPSVNADGTAAAANLLPFPAAQPLRIYNRGQDNEHYGFYTYFDRSIFLKNNALANNSSSDFSNIPADENGGSTFDSATVRCTWAQTRFLVQIWTNAGNKLHLLPGPAASSSSGSSSSTSSGSAAKPTASSSSSSAASAFVRPGTFPYPVSITLDRHGGDTSKKMLYCYGMDQTGRIILAEKKLALENKKIGGTIVNPTDGPFQNVTVSPKLGGPGGIDGGTGGCGCRWENFLAS